MNTEEKTFYQTRIKDTTLYIRNRIIPQNMIPQTQCTKRQLEDGRPTPRKKPRQMSKRYPQNASRQPQNILGQILK